MLALPSFYPFFFFFFFFFFIAVWTDQLRPLGRTADRRRPAHRSSRLHGQLHWGIERLEGIRVQHAHSVTQQKPLDHLHGFDGLRYLNRMFFLYFSYGSTVVSLFYCFIQLHLSNENTVLFLWNVPFPLLPRVPCRSGGYYRDVASVLLGRLLRALVTWIIK